MSARVRSFAVMVGLVAALAAATAFGAEDPQLAKIAAMPPNDLESFVDTITATVTQDTLKMRTAGEQGDCLELTRTANAFALGYRYLAAANDTIDPRTRQELLPLKAKIVQARVITFAARVKAEEWLKQRCAAFVPPEAEASDPRYEKPARLQINEFATAVIEARQAGEANLAGAVAASRLGRCPEAISAVRGLQLFLPYVDKLLTDLKYRPQALGPRASRRGLENLRVQLVTAVRALDAQYAPLCNAPNAGAAPAAPAPAAP